MGVLKHGRLSAAIGVAVFLLAMSSAPCVPLSFCRMTNQRSIVSARCSGRVRFR